MGASPPALVADLVERFSRDRKVFLSPDYKEEQLRVEFDLRPSIRHSDFVIRTLPHEFSVLPADILGQVYEQFLGKVIRLTAEHQAKVEEKPEVRKAGGVYYTPTYIVDYIVKNTVGKLPEGRTPACLTNARRHSKMQHVFAHGRPALTEMIG